MTQRRPPLPEGVRSVVEERVNAAVPLHVHPEWRERFPWLVQGSTGHGDEGFDLGLFGEVPAGTAWRRWRALREETGLSRAVHGRQVHGAAIARHDAGEPGLHIVDDVDGHVTARPGILLTVSTADCVPISLIHPPTRRVALLHGGWRGTAAGVVAAGLSALAVDPDGTWAHLGPAICGDCYEVGPEVHEALGQPVPAGPVPIDVRAVQARQLTAAGVSASRITVSAHCTLHGDGFFSHRGGDDGRQVGLLGVREAG